MHVISSIVLQLIGEWEEHDMHTILYVLLYKNIIHDQVNLTIPYLIPYLSTNFSLDPEFPFSVRFLNIVDKLDRLLALH